MMPARLTGWSDAARVAARARALEAPQATPAAQTAGSEQDAPDRRAAKRRSARSWSAFRMRSLALTASAGAIAGLSVLAAALRVD